MPGILLRNINKTFNETTVVNNINLEIKDKEFLILVGPSGCGKSTTLRMIAGLEEISGGELWIDDNIVNEVESKDRDIAMVFQNYALYPHMTVFKNMAFGLQLRKISEKIIEEKVHQAAETLDITHLLNRKPRALSGGQRQRVALGRAMVRDPNIFLLDEPLSNLDAKLRTTMRAEITKLHKRLDSTFIYVTHDQVEAMTMADRIVVMKDGDILQVDTPQNLYDHPVNMFVAGFIGAPEMNMFKVKIEKNASGLVAKFHNFEFSIPNEDRFAPISNYIDSELVLGIRPENFYDAKPFDVPDHQLTQLVATVDLVEPMGAEIHFNLIVHDHKLVAKLSSRCTSVEGDNLPLFIDMASAHFFDPMTENSVLSHKIEG